MIEEADLHKLLRNKSDIIFKYLIKIGANPRDAEDIVQDALYKFLLYMDSVDTSKVFSWLFRVAINRYYDLCRKQKKQIQISFENYELVDEAPLPEDYIHNKELRNDIQIILDQLKPLYKQLLVMKYDMELSYEEIAEMLDLNPGTLKTYLYRAREAFKEIYRRELEKYE
ncbi:RNA polymerase sigma factor [Metabacillus halosaccharovorans]|uniref:RNA polymerase sigma factor n=1 Tax=Metabacillus halosaccharovorans TaxID=930124 RepID=UPI00099491AD|nr:RNA polymerase sigma factor [Metabacillus halosaccharovorans]